VADPLEQHNLANGVLNQWAQKKENVPCVPDCVLLI